MQQSPIDILGAGLVGSLLASMLAKKNQQVSVFEKRSDPRLRQYTGGRSINLALSHRGIRALKMAGIYEQISSALIPMHGRMIHDLHGDRTVQTYGKKGEFINSVSRSELNIQLIQHAINQGANFHFDHKCLDVDLENQVLTFEKSSAITQKKASVIFGADGAFSVLRQQMQKTGRFNFEQHYIDYGYQELTINPIAGKFAMEPNYLHIWPRGNFMLIALPNPDQSFTCTLFFPFQGQPSFKSVQTEQDYQNLFESYFSDVLDMEPNIVKQCTENPVASLITIKCAPWSYKNALLIGDAAHAIVPFYGQGMNAGFEDCTLLMEQAEQKAFNWSEIIPAFGQHRKTDADAIADLAMKNFIEMRDKVADERFLKIKRLEARIHEQYPDQWTPLYSMVTFSDIPYSQSLKEGMLQEKITSQLPEDFDPELIDLKWIVDQLNIAKQVGL